MIEINKTSISLTRGDSAYINFTLTGDDGQPVVLNQSDKVRCQVRDKTVSGKLIFEGSITVSGSQIVWHIRPEDTMNAEIGTYYWDAQVEYANGDVFTFVEVSRFTLLPEITLLNNG